MTELRWIDKRALLLLHDEDLTEHGGLPGLRDEGLLDSALARPLNLLAYGEPSMAALAAAYAFGIARNHPFADGNKRAALLSVGLFLAINEISFRPDKVEATQVFLALAADEISEEELVAWIDRNSAKRKRLG
jgi:death on curing protein